MAALIKERHTPEIRLPAHLREFPVAAGVKCLAGGLAVLEGGFAKPGATDTDLVAVGRFEETVDNTGGSAGDVTVKVKRGIFCFANSASTDAITRQEIGTTCYVVDDQTVAKTSATNTRSAAGRVYDVDATGVWVEFP